MSIEITEAVRLALRYIADRCAELAQSTPIAGEPDPRWWERQAALSDAADKINEILALQAREDVGESAEPMDALWAVLYLHDWDPKREDGSQPVYPECSRLFVTWQEAERHRKTKICPEKYYVRKAHLTTPLYTHPTPADPGDALREAIDRSDAIEALCQSRCTIPDVHWADGMTEGTARIERMLAEKQLDAILSLLTTSAAYQAGRLAGIEESAKATEGFNGWSYVRIVDGEWLPGSPYDRGQEAAARHIAEAIRKLGGAQ